MSTKSPPSTFPVSVVMERREVTQGPWSESQWEVVAVVAGEGVEAASARTLVHQSERLCRYVWTGFTVALYKDGCESYWYNLLSPQPCLFVVCYLDDEDEDGFEPFIITPNQDEANAHMELDDPVFSVPMPEQVHQWVERFVVANYQPEEKKKRKRRNWTNEAKSAGSNERLH